MGKRKDQFLAGFGAIIGLVFTVVYVYGFMSSPYSMVGNMWRAFTEEEKPPVTITQDQYNRIVYPERTKQQGLTDDEILQLVADKPQPKSDYADLDHAFAIADRELLQEKSLEADLAVVLNDAYIVALGTDNQEVIANFEWLHECVRKEPRLARYKTEMMLLSVENDKLRNGKMSFDEALVECKKIRKRFLRMRQDAQSQQAN